MQLPILIRKSFISRNSFPDNRALTGLPVISALPVLVLPESHSETDSATALSSESSNPASTPAAPRSSMIYIVDDMPELTEFSTAILEATGYIVRAFNDRHEALDTLKAEERKPNLLITDCLGGSMPIGRFIRHCRVLHPTIRILMVTGLDQAESLISDTSPDRLIRKPFTLEELQQKIRAALTAR